MTQSAVEAVVETSNSFPHFNNIISLRIFLSLPFLLCLSGSEFFSFCLSVSLSLSLSLCLLIQ